MMDLAEEDGYEKWQAASSSTNPCFHQATHARWSISNCQPMKASKIEICTTNCKSTLVQLEYKYKCFRFVQRKIGTTDLSYWFDAHVSVYDWRFSSDTIYARLPNVLWLYIQ